MCKRDTHPYNGSTMDTKHYSHPCSALRLHLLSDLHIGSAYTQYDRIAKDVDAARLDETARIAIAGDVFDAIVPGDKRFNLNKLHPRVQHGDTVNRAVDWAVELLRPVRDKILLVGEGNHETKYTKATGCDPLGMLCDGLGISGARAAYVGILTLQVEKHRYNVAWWHGSGGGASRQSAVKQSGRLLEVFNNLDLAWTGHKHQRYAAPVIRYSVPRSGKPKPRQVWLVMSGSYMRESDYAMESLHPPGDIGSVFAFFKDGKINVVL